MLDLVRSSLHKVLTHTAGDSFLPVRLPKDLARRVNVVFGEPICSAAEIERRRAATAKLEQLKADAKAGKVAAAMPREPSPVIVYFEKDRNVRLLVRIKEALDAKSFKYQELEVDAPTKAYVMREAKCKEDDLPIVFVATTPIGGYNDLVEWDVSGKLATAVYGTDAPAKNAHAKA